MVCLGPPELVCVNNTTTFACAPRRPPREALFLSPFLNVYQLLHSLQIMSLQVPVLNFCIDSYIWRTGWNCCCWLMIFYYMICFYLLPLATYYTIYTIRVENKLRDNFFIVLFFFVHGVVGTYWIFHAIRKHSERPARTKAAQYKWVSVACK